VIATVKAEFRKLLTVRTTYVITLLVIVAVSLIAFFLEGWNLKGAALQDPAQLAGDVTGALNITVFGAIVAILLVTHEYRYNTIMYTLTSSKSRSKVLVAKFITISAYALFLAALIGVLSPVMSYLGVHAHGNVLAPQVLDYGDLIWRSLFYGWAYGMFGLLLALLTRNQVASIVTLFLIPDLVEQLLGFLLLKHNTVYMPFSALAQVINGPGPQGMPTASSLSSGHAALVVCAYLVVGWIVAWILFLKRDAN
jgi:ABC-type transport system involved in multi-copper enzyme maturation permease subunit